MKPLAQTVPFKYRAFLSYSHADSAIARRVHERLERFRIDKDLVGRETPAGLIPETLRPIFRDRHEFNAGGSLAEQTVAALDSAAALVVLASPNTARSTYVNEELRLFKSRHPDRPVIPLIADGEPGNPGCECFPPALRFALAGDGAITDRPVDVLAADLREKGDGFELAIAKVVARLLGLAPDDVYRRAERERRRQRRLQAAVAAVIVALAAAGSGFYWQSRQKAQTLAEITALVDKYSLITPAAADTPGSRQSLTLAIKNIAEGAATDPRYAQALDLLKAGQPAQAEPLLQAVAEDKVKLGQKQGQDAAAAYRNLASITAVTDPAKARGYYAEAARLDPTNVQGMLQNGIYQEQAGQLDAAQAAYTSVLAATASGNDDEAALWAKLGMGDIAQRRGHLADALSAYQDAATIAAGLAKADPNNVQSQRDVTFVDERLGNVQVAQGNLTAALASYRASLAAADTLARANPSNAKLQHDVAFFEQKLGNVQESQGDRAGALSTFQAALAIIDGLAKSDPSNMLWQSDLAAATGNVGYVQLLQNDLPAALTSYRAGLAIMAALITTDAGNDLWQRQLSVTYNNIGNVQMAQGDKAGALASYQAGLAIAQQLAKSDPANIGWQRDLALANGYVGNAEQRQGNLPAALLSYQAALTIMQAVATADSASTQWQRDLAVSYNHVGSIQTAQGDQTAALASYQAGLVIAQHLAKSDSSNAGWQRDLAISYGFVADVQEKERDLPDAVTSYQASLPIKVQLAKTDSTNAQAKRDLALTYGKLAELYRRLGQAYQAGDALASGRAIIASLAGQDPSQALYQQDLARFDKQIAALKQP